MITIMLSAMENDLQREFVEEIYQKYYFLMLKKAVSLSGNLEDAEETVQEVFVGIIKRIDYVMEVERKKLPAYLVSAVKYGSYTRNKKQSRWNFTDFESEEIELLKDDYPLPEELYLKTETVNELKTALEKIPQKYRNILEFKYILGLSDREIGEKFKISETAVRSCLARARRKAYSAMKGEE